MRTPIRRTALLLSVLALAVPSTVGAAAPEAESSGICLRIFGCEEPDSKEPKEPAGKNPTVDPAVPAPAKPDSPSEKPADPVKPGPTKSPEPSETPTEEPTDTPTDEPTDEPTEEPTDDPSGIPAEPVKPTDDDDSPIFTKHPAAMGSESLSFSGLSRISIVRVPTADGGKTTALKISADSISIKGFSLTVSPPDKPAGGGLVTKADTMTLKGNVSVYIGSITATTKDGKSLTLGTKTAPPLDDVKPGLLRVTMGLVGSTADSIEYTTTDQKIKEP